jgi:hypothetical protein
MVELSVGLAVKVLPLCETVAEPEVTVYAGAPYVYAALGLTVVLFPLVADNKPPAVGLIVQLMV